MADGRLDVAVAIDVVEVGGGVGVGVEDDNGAVTVVVDTWVVPAEVDSPDDETLSLSFPHANPIEQHSSNLTDSRQSKSSRASG